MKLIKLLIIFLILIYQNISYANNNSLLINKITKNLRCLICQGQSVYDSQSDFANSVKILVDKKIQEGNSEEEIYEYLINKYGQWVVYDPEINKKTLFLWLFPVILFVFGGLLIMRKVFIK
tara:strand:- start:944 stop:1306 length:363 start_codon:yes stop_codon:yes gene_type:complete